MSSLNAGLRHLHDVLLKLREANDAVAQGPRQIAARAKLVEKRQAEVDDRRQKQKLLRMATDQKNLQLKTNEAKIRDLQAKLNAVANNREYDILRNQISADTMANSVLEDEILEGLQLVDQAQLEIQKGDADLAQTQADLQKLKDDVKAREPGLRDVVAQLERQLAEAEHVLPADIAPTYRRLVQAHGADALAPVEQKSCSACFVGMTSQMLMELNSGKLRFCKSCAKLLYVPERL